MNPHELALLPPPRKGATEGEGDGGRALKEFASTGHLAVDKRSCCNSSMSCSDSPVQSRPVIISLHRVSSSMLQCSSIFGLLFRLDLDSQSKP